MAGCEKCGKYFANVRQLGPHRRHCFSSSSEEQLGPHPLHCSTSSLEELHCSTSSSEEQQEEGVRHNANTTITTPLVNTDIHVNEPGVIDLKDLARRRPDWGIKAPVTVPHTGTASLQCARDVRAVWNTYSHICSFKHIYVHLHTYIFICLHIHI